MKKALLLAIILCFVSLTACNNAIDNVSDSSLPEDNPFNMREADNSDDDAIALGGYSFGPADAEMDGKPLVYSYDGGEMVVEYTISSGDKPTKAGFLIFVDGIPQPYKINDANADYEYLHEFSLTPNEHTDFNFIFTPVTGQKGETLDIYVAGIFNPMFIPDMVETNSYGVYHGLLPALPIKLNFNVDTKNAAEGLLSKQNVLKNAKSSTENISNDVRKEYDGRLDDYAFIDIFAGGTNISYLNTLDAGDKKDISIQLKGFGKEGLKYRTTLYLNHQPVKSIEQDCWDMNISKGDVSIISLDLDTSSLTGLNTLYAVSVPIEYDANNEVNIIKSGSLLVIADSNSMPKTEPTESSEQTPEASAEPTESSGQAPGPNSRPTESSGQTPEPSSQPTETPKPITEHASQPADITVGGTASELKTEELFNGITARKGGIYDGGDGTILVISDKLYRLDIKNQTVLAETSLLTFDNSETYHVTNDGYCAIGSKQNKIVCVMLDKNLKQTGEMNLTDLFEIDSTPCIAVSKTGKVFAYATQYGLFTYDTVEKTKFTVMDFDTKNAEKNKNLVAFTNLAFTNEDKSLAFIGGVIIQGNTNSETTFGMVNTDGPGLINNKSTVPQLECIGASNSYVAFSEGIYVSRTAKSSGEVSILESATQSLSKYSLVDKNESQHLFLSDEGKHFVTSVQNGSKELIYRVYDSETGKLLKEFTQSFIGKAGEQAMKTSICISDSTQKFIVVTVFGKDAPMVGIYEF